MRKFRRRDNEPEPIDAILARAGEDRWAPARPPVPFVVWRASVGPRIAEQAVPISLEGGTLLLRTTSSTWASELSMLSDDIRARLAEHGVVVQQLRFRVGRLELPARPVERRATRVVPAPIPLPEALSDRVASVPDADLRDEIARAASQALAWSEAVNESRRAALAPRSAGRGSAPPDQTERADREAPPRNRGGGPDRSR